MMKPFKIALLALMLPVLTDVAAQSKPSKSSSFKSGFSSGKSTPASNNRSFGSFGGRSATPPRAPSAEPRKSGGFGSFGGSAPRNDGAAAPAARKSDSALSQGLGKGDAQANALRTLDQRRAAEQARNAPAPVPAGPAPSDPRYGNNTASNNGNYGGNSSSGNYGGNGGYHQPTSAPIIINNGNNNGGLVNVITGFLLGRATSASHAQTNGYPGAVTPAGTVASAPAPSGGGFFTSLLRTFAWLAILATIGWLLYFGWKFLRRGRAPSQANYSFERN